jgi:hypothetical protein
MSLPAGKPNDGRRRAATAARPPRDRQTPAVALAGAASPPPSPRAARVAIGGRIGLPRQVAFALALVVATPATAQEALHISEGSVARSQVVALGRDLVVLGEASMDVAAVNGDARIHGRVGGSVVVLGGDVRLEAPARIEGDVFVLGGELFAAPGTTIVGRSVAYPSVGAAWLTLLEGPSLGLAASSPVVLAAKLALIASWLALTLALLATGGRQVLATSRTVREEPGRSFVTGLTGVLALFLTALLLSALSAAVVGLPMLALVGFFALLLKLWGMVAVFHALGEALGRWVLRRRLMALNAACLGLVVLGAVKLLPWAGTLAWWAATFVGVGATLQTKFGRREPWLLLAPEASSA